MAVDWLLVLPMQVEALDLAVAGGTASAMSDEAARLEDLATVSNDPVHLALAARGRAEAALALGRLRQAEDSLGRAEGLLSAVSAPVARHRIEQTAARVHGARGRAEDEARAWGRAARVLLSLARSLGGFPGARDRFLAAPAVTGLLREARRCGEALAPPV